MVLRLGGVICRRKQAISQVHTRANIKARQSQHKGPEEQPRAHGRGLAHEKKPGQADYGVGLTGTSGDKKSQQAAGAGYSRAKHAAQHNT